MAERQEPWQTADMYRLNLARDINAAMKEVVYCIETNRDPQGWLRFVCDNARAIQGATPLREVLSAGL